MESREHIQKIEHLISWGALLRIVVVVLAIFLIWNLGRILLLVLLALMLASALYPIVRFFNRKISLPIAAVLVTLLIFIPIIVIGVVLISSFIEQLPSLLKTLNSILKQSDILPPAIRSIDLTQYAQGTGQYILQSTTRITVFVTSILTIIFLNLYILMDSKNLYKTTFDLIPADKREGSQRLLSSLIRINGHYIRGNLLISLICGIFISSGLLILNVPYAIPLGIFAGLLDLLPLIGSLVGSAPAIILGFAISPITGLLVTGLFILYQQLENNVLAPNIYNKVLAISPTISFIAVLIGASLFGIVGAFIALPVAASLPTVIQFIKKEDIRIE